MRACVRARARGCVCVRVCGARVCVGARVPACVRACVFFFVGFASNVLSHVFVVKGADVILVRSEPHGNIQSCGMDRRWIGGMGWGRSGVRLV